MFHTPRKRLVILMLLAGSGVPIVSGCAAEAKTSNTSERQIDVHPDGTVSVRYTNGGTSHSTAPGSTSQPTEARSSDSGSIASASGRQTPPTPPDFTYGLAQRQWILIGGGAACIIGAAFAAYKLKYQLAMFLVAAGCALFAGQAFIDWAPYIIGFVIVGGAAWFFSRLLAHKHESESAILNARTYAREGNATAASAALNETPVARTNPV